MSAPPSVHLQFHEFASRFSFFVVVLFCLFCFFAQGPLSPSPSLSTPRPPPLFFFFWWGEVVDIDYEVSVRRRMLSAMP